MFLVVGATRADMGDVANSTCPTSDPEIKPRTSCGLKMYMLRTLDTIPTSDPSLAHGLFNLYILVIFYVFSIAC